MISNIKDYKDQEPLLIEFIKDIMINKIDITKCKIAIECFKTSLTQSEKGVVTAEQVFQEERKSTEKWNKRSIKHFIFFRCNE